MLTSRARRAANVSRLQAGTRLSLRRRGLGLTGAAQHRKRHGAAPLHAGDRMQRVTLIDNYDSFTFNLVHYLGELGAEVSVWRNDEITVADTLGRKAGRDRAVARTLHAERGGRMPRPRPLGQRNDADARRLSRPSGDRSGVRRRHRARASADAWQGLAHFASCARALSRSQRTLSGDALSFSHYRAGQHAPELEITAESDDGLVMGVEHRDRPALESSSIPESIASEHGRQILRNFLDLAAAFQQRQQAF